MESHKRNISEFNINTGMKGFVLIDRVKEISQETIFGNSIGLNGFLFKGIEVLAQFGALHVRYLCDFKSHAFLLKVENCNFFVQSLSEGKIDLEGQLVSKSQSAFSYDLSAKSDGSIVMSGKFLFAVTNYDSRFKSELLEQHYKQVYSCLRNDTKDD
ncbi:hypothetical protein QUF76_18125 [Desulfobacterales bacterium HSG16]|nr:hypothetical protein [Desulfobacterales bacterium HSG16]